MRRGERLVTLTEERLAELEEDAGPGDLSLRHLVPRVSPRGELPAVYSKRALCGAKVEELVGGGVLCEECLEVERTRLREPRA